MKASTINMTKLPLFLFLLSSSSIFAQRNKNVSVFHRLLIYNDNSELLVVKFKNKDIWVTPGFYQDTSMQFRSAAHKMAGTYGLTISDPVLKGMFTMKEVVEGKTSIAQRNMYACQVKSGLLKKPDFLGEVRWVSMKEAYQLISFPHINAFIKPTWDHPNTIWGGEIMRTKKNGKDHIEITEAFYPLFHNSKKKKRRKWKKRK